MSDEADIENPQEVQPKKGISGILVPPERCVEITTSEEKNSYLSQGSHDHMVLSPAHADKLYQGDLILNDFVYRVHDAIPERSESVSFQARVPESHIIEIFRSHPDAADRALVLDMILLEIRNIASDPNRLQGVIDQLPLVEGYNTFIKHQLNAANHLVAELRKLHLLDGVESQAALLERYATHRLDLDAYRAADNNEAALRRQMAKQKELWRQERERREKEKADTEQKPDKEG